jgi:hypothetical protein
MSEVAKIAGDAKRRTRRRFLVEVEEPVAADFMLAQKWQAADQSAREAAPSSVKEACEMAHRRVRTWEMLSEMGALQHAMEPADNVSAPPVERIWRASFLAIREVLGRT